MGARCCAHATAARRSAQIRMSFILAETRAVCVVRNDSHTCASFSQSQMRTRLLLALALRTTLRAATPAWRTDWISPRIAGLINRAKGRDGAALEDFWQEIKALGTPLVEPVQEDAGHVLVTFLYRSSSANGVVLTAQLATSREPILLQRPAGTDVWYKIYYAFRILIRL